MFKPWADFAYYALVREGTFERLTAWRLADAVRTLDNETFHVNGDRDRWSLSLPPGSSATSPSMCVGVEHPVIRFFARNPGAATSTLRVHVLYEDATGSSRSALIAELAAGGTWAPTPQIVLVANGFALSSGNQADIRLRFSPTGSSGDWRIDGVHVDPYRKG